MFSVPVHKVERRGGFFVDIGERDFFYVEMEDTEEYRELHRSESSVVVKSTSISGDALTIRVSWSKYKRIAQGKGYTGMRICGSLRYVPEMYSRELHMVGSTHVEASTREYVEGYPLCDVWGSMSSASKDKVTSQMENIVYDISRYTSSTFMKLQGKNLATQSPVSFINYRIVLSMITNSLAKGDMKTLDMEDFKYTAVLCHNNLSMHHVIVSGDNITGIVGWIKYDYMPEIISRLQYQFCPSPPLLYSVHCMYYSYYIRLRSTPEHCHRYLERKLSVRQLDLSPARLLTSVVRVTL